MKNLPNISDRILDISVNLARVGNWAADSYEQKHKLIKFFLDQTQEYLSQIEKSKVSKDFRPVLEKFSLEFEKLKHDDILKDKNLWAERALTWANILSHRAKLA